jgi:hypothetical protein
LPAFAGASHRLEAHDPAAQGFPDDDARAADETTAEDVADHEGDTVAVHGERGHRPRVARVRGFASTGAAAATATRIVPSAAPPRSVRITRLRKPRTRRESECAMQSRVRPFGQED